MKGEKLFNTFTRLFIEVSPHNSYATIIEPSYKVMNLVKILARTRGEKN